MKFLIKYIKEMKEELRRLQEKNKELDEHIVSLAHIYDTLANEMKNKRK